MRLTGLSLASFSVRLEDGNVHCVSSLRIKCNRVPRNMNVVGVSTGSAFGICSGSGNVSFRNTRKVIAMFGALNSMITRGTTGNKASGVGLNDKLCLIELRATSKRMAHGMMIG